MTLRESLAHFRLFFSCFLALLGLAFILRGGNSNEWFLGSLIGGVGFTSLILIWLAATAGEREK